ncbi:rhodanese-like domain-containing protein [Psychrobacter pygoscelis]|uniref:rhodanese-like domain-containing protein n=1 Tax=Psychrobacter pygoscelis TaxID=2488563 RepID=UPI00103D63DA|nr:rhodanese-like domain-containing protein [Psychrobacter pygoscelis]
MSKLALPILFVLSLGSLLLGCQSTESAPEESHSGITDSLTQQESQVELIKEIDQSRLLAWLDSPATPLTLIDVRSPEEYATGHIDRAINIPHYKIIANPSLVSQFSDHPVVIYCRSGARASKVTDALKQSGLTQNIYHLQGDIIAWNEAKLPLVVE